MKGIMPRRTADELAATPLSLVYIAGNLDEARAIEQWLTDGGIEYALSLEPFTTTSYLTHRERMGLFVYVPTAQHRLCRDLLESHGLTETVALDTPESPEMQEGG